MNTIDEKLWDYIDGNCSEEEKKTIETLIAQNDAYRHQYEQILILNQQFSKIELDEPPMAFTYNIMESIRAEQAQIPLKAKVDKRIIRGISIFFVLTILALLIFSLSMIHLSPVHFSTHLPDKLTMPEIGKYFNNSVLKGFLFLDTVLGLYLLDKYLHKKTISKQM